MLKNKHVKEYLARLFSGHYALVESNVPSYPTLDARTATVAIKTADYTVLQSDLDAPTIFNNTGDAGVQVLTLPAVAKSRGKVLRATCLAAQIIRLLPQTGEIVNLNGSVVVTKYLNMAGVIGNYVEVVCDGTQWVVTHYAGVVTKEA